MLVSTDLPSKDECGNMQGVGWLTIFVFEDVHDWQNLSVVGDKGLSHKVCGHDEVL